MIDIRNKKICVIGAARSGLAVSKLLSLKGAIVFVSDSGEEESLKESVEYLKINQIAFEVGGHTEKVFDSSLIVISPGVPSNAQILVKALQKGIKIVSEIEVAAWFCSTPIVAVTGSNGKTTTTTLIGEIFDRAGKENIVAGNIGTAFSEKVFSLKENSTAILEVSSFQLDHIDKFRPKVSVITNITPDHMDRYGNSMEKYSASKARIFINQHEDDILIYNYDDGIVSALASKAKCKLLPFSLKIQLTEGAFVRDNTLTIIYNEKLSSIINTTDINIKGSHNIYNSMAAALAAKCMGINDQAITDTLKNFKGVEHRLEFVRELNGVKYINDSKATNVDSVWYAIDAVDSPIILLLGGRDKGNDYKKLFKIVHEKVKAIIAIGESADKVFNEFREIVEVKKAETMETAVQEAREISTAGDTVLLSPACASFDWFKNYEHRGKIFKEAVNKL